MTLKQVQSHIIMLFCIVLLQLSKSAPKPRFFSDIERYQNRGFRLSIDGFSFFRFWNGAVLMFSAMNVRPNKCTKHQFIHLLTATFKDLHIENSRNYKRWYCPHHTDCVSMCCWI